MGGMFTYAGFTDQETLLETIYRRGLAGERVGEELELYEADDLIMSWSHTPRMPWQVGEAGERYYEEQRRSLREATFDRLHRNRWRTSETAAIVPETWDACVYVEHAPLAPTREMVLIGGLDTAPKSDTSGCVFVAWDGDVLVHHHLWTPTKGTPLDYALIDEYVRWVCASFRVGKLVLDPYQMHSLCTRWQQDGLPAVEFAQTRRT